MRTFLLSTLLAATLSPVASRAQTSPVVGFIQRTVAGTADAGAPMATVLSFPLRENAIFTGVVSGVDSANAFSARGANWSAGQFTSRPHVAHFLNGDATGQWFLVTGNAATQLTVNPRAQDLAGTVSAGDGFEIFPAHTLGSVFGAASVPLQTGASAAEADTVQIWNGRRFKTYFHNGAFWTKGDAGLDSNDALIPPDAGVFVNRRAPAAVTLTFNGAAPETAERSDVPGPGTTFLGNRFPLDTTISALGLAGLANWTGGDSVQLWKKAAWQTFSFNGTSWVRPDTGAVVDAKKVAAGTAVLVVRQSAGSGTAASLLQVIPSPAN